MTTTPKPTHKSGKKTAIQVIAADMGAIEWALSRNKPVPSLHLRDAVLAHLRESVAALRNRQAGMAVTRSRRYGQQVAKEPREDGR